MNDGTTVTSDACGLLVERAGPAAEEPDGGRVCEIRQLLGDEPKPCRIGLRLSRIGKALGEDRRKGRAIWRIFRAPGMTSRG